MMQEQQLRNVSRETLNRLRHFEKLVLKWTKKINLVSAGDAVNIWNRHIIDSMQVYHVAPKVDHWLDLGSGGGFPGIVAAIMAQDDAAECRFTLVDSDQRKCVFLRTVARELELEVSVKAVRIDDLEPQSAGVVTARALGDLSVLLDYVNRHMSSAGTALLPKGITWEAEHVMARDRWFYDLEAIRSETNPGATILKIKELKRV